MASSFSTDLKLELMVTGENAGTWGDKTNTNLNLVQQAIAGFESISIAGGAQTTNLVMTNATLSNARNAVIKLTGTITGNQIVTVPTGIEKTYIVQNGTTGAFTVEFKQAGGTGTTFSTTDKNIKILFADGTNINTVDLSTLSGTVVSAQIANLAVTSAKLASFAVTEARLASFAVTTSRLATDAVTGIKITQSTITQSKLAANSVGSNQLISTGVTAASYTTANFTVDADGRITAASSGSAGAGMGIVTRVTPGPASGTHTAGPTATRLATFLYAGGGGSGGWRSNQPGGTGGSGGYGYYQAPVVAPFSQPFAVGGGGNGGNCRACAPGNAGNAGGNTNLTNIGTVNLGNAGGGAPIPMSGTPGNSGNQPGASLSGFNRSFTVGNSSGNIGFGVGGVPTGPTPIPCMGANNPSNPGQPGLLVVFENTGT